MGYAKQADGYDMDDEVPLSLLRRRGSGQMSTNRNNSIVISEDLRQPTEVSVNMKEGIDTVSDPGTGVVNGNDDLKQGNNNTEMRKTGHDKSEEVNISSTEGDDCPIRDFPYYATFREKGAKLACADKLGVFLSLTLCKKASFEYLAFIK